MHTSHIPNINKVPMQLDGKEYSINRKVWNNLQWNNYKGMFSEGFKACTTELWNEIWSVIIHTYYSCLNEVKISMTKKVPQWS